MIMLGVRRKFLIKIMSELIFVIKLLINLHLFWMLFCRIIWDCVFRSGHHQLHIMRNTLIRTKNNFIKFDLLLLLTRGLICEWCVFNAKRGDLFFCLHNPALFVLRKVYYTHIVCVQHHLLLGRSVIGWGIYF